MRTGNQHCGREYDDLQNLFDMTSLENAETELRAEVSPSTTWGWGMQFWNRVSFTILTTAMLVSFAKGQHWKIQ